MNPPADAIQTVGTGPDLLLIHGTAADASSWRPLVRLLQNSARVTSYDRRGSTHWPLEDGAAPPLAADHAADAGDVILRLGSRPVYACGLSFGGVIVLELLRQHPELVRAAVLFEPALAVDRHAAAVPAALLTEFERLVREGKGPEAAERFHRRLLSDRGWALLPAEAKAQACSLWRQIHFDLIATAAYQPRYDDLVHTTVPVLLLRGGRSRPVFEAAVHRLETALPCSQRKVLEHADHWIVGRGWSELAAVLTELMRRS